jgi:hypothetical protein
MSILNTLKNSINTPTEKVITNASPGIDRGVDFIPVVANSTPSNTTVTEQDARKFEDLQLVKKNIFNCRLAMELCPTTWSSVISLVMVSDKKFDIVGDDEADEEAIQHLKQKVKEWDMRSSMLSSRYKGAVDGRCFVEKYIKPGTVTIESLTHQAYDSGKYDFMEVRDPYTNIVLGYKQKACIYPVPSNWEAMSFDLLANRQSEDKETTFKPDQVFMPRFLYGDGVSEGLVCKVLDDAYILKELKNMVPTSIKMGAATLGVQMGIKDQAFKPYNDSDSYEEKEAKARAKMVQASQDFTDKWDKEVIFYSYGMDPKVIGQGQLVNFTPQIELFKQEIRAGLLTPDSQFESASSNRAVAQEQMSGDMGRVTVVDFVNNNYIRSYYEKSVLDHELLLNGFDSSVNHIWIEFEDTDKEDETLLKDIGSELSKIRPDFFTPENDIGIQAYFPKIVPFIQSMNDKDKKKGQKTLDNFNPKQEGNVDEEGNSVTITNSYGGIADHQDPTLFLNSVKDRLVEEGYLV